MLRRPINHRERWSAADLLTLKRLIESKTPMQHKANELERSQEAIRTKAASEGMTSGPTKSRPYSVGRSSGAFGSHVRRHRANVRFPPIVNIGSRQSGAVGATPGARRIGKDAILKSLPHAHDLRRPLVPPFGAPQPVDRDRERQADHQPDDIGRVDHPVAEHVPQEHRRYRQQGVQVGA